MDYKELSKTRDGYPVWVGALAFSAFIFALACIGGIFAELACHIVGLIGRLV